MIEQSRINHIKTSVDLKGYIEQATGSAFKKNGKGYICKCPFPDHEDKTPSFIVTPQENLWNCFGCGRGGDIFEFDQLYFNLDFKGSVKKHGSFIPSKKKAKAAVKKKTSPKKDLTVKEQKLLGRVISYYQHTFAEDPTGLKYLKNRGITNNQSLTDFGTGYANATLLNILPEDDEIIKSLKKIGILNTRGKEVFYNCVVVPLYNEKGAVVNLYGRNIDEDCNIKHLYLPGKRNGLVNRQAAKRSQTLILTESIIDALTLYDQGFKNVMPIYGTNGLIDDHLFFFNRKIKEAYLVFDADDAGRKAAQSVSLQLKEKNIISYIIDLPVKDVNIYFNRHTPEEFETLLKQANPRSLEQSDKINNRKKTLYKETDHGFVVGYGDRQYQIKGIQRGDTQLKATIKASIDVQGNLPFELTTIDLYSTRSRTWFAKLCADLFKASAELIREDIGKLLILVETFKPETKKTDHPAATKEETRLAMTFLKNPDMIEEMLSDLATMGVIGELVNKTVCYLATTSRKLAKPISVLIQSRSSAGKSTLQNAILSLMPEEEYENYTRVTDQSLFYKEEDSLVHKILAIEEDVGMGGAAYSIRNIQSSGKITVATTGKDPGTGKMKTEDYTVKGPVAVMLTTTAADLDQETASRFVFLSIDESPAMTAAIHEKQRESRTLKGLVQKTKTKHIIKKHQNAQRLLKSIAVVNDFTQYLSYPCKSLITRRDHEKYLGLIDTMAFLHQYQRDIKTMEIDNEPVEYIEVTLKDIEKANKIANEVLGHSLDELARPSRVLLDSIYKMVKRIAKTNKIPVDEVFFTRRMIREHMDWSDWQIKTHVKQLEELEYLYIRIGSRGKEYAYALNYKGQGEDTNKFFLNLTPVEEIKKLMNKEGDLPN
ncbi:MAG: CHC2 zinc finger domain-containing protein [Desulfobacula sp.]|nr:CHC2 zinc finger domain-containing protein [Desulfobacula sp.]MCF6247128.1 CHC2 zinc finger domain-containing protein [Desulfobacula sp.]